MNFSRTPQAIPHLKGIILVAFLWGTGMVAAAQQPQGIKRIKKFDRVYADSVYTLGNWVIPSSIKVKSDGRTLPEKRWQFNPVQGTWRWLPDTTRTPADFLPEVTISYRSIPYKLKPVYYRRREVPLDTAFAADTTIEGQTVLRKTALSESDLFGEVNLDKSGSLTRGFTVGSDQDLSLESGLQFDMQGQLSENIEVVANLTDQSTPVQPDGSTQNLREFDKVFIQVRSPTTNLRLGDVDISLERSEFARINRRIQGAAGKVETPYGNAKAAISVARGKFKTMRFDGTDGVQGPYRLTGRQGEQFITVLAGTERVYINGERVYRGEENAYTIDYGLGEIHFTNNQIITDETRIVVDFQYINRDYNRTLLTAEAHEDSLLGGDLSVTTSYVREADSEGPGTRLSLTDREMRALRQAGDEGAVVSGADSVGYRPESDFLQYARVDTTMGGERYTIYKHIPGSEKNVYRVNFSNVGTGNGAYRRTGTSLNGILYQWVGPGNGSYAPFERIAAPIRHEMLSVKSEYELMPGVQIFGEWAGSKFDENRFSSLDDRDNADLAYKAGARIDSVQTAVGRFSAQIHRRFTGSAFQNFGRTREVEFDRKWNITGGAPESAERITEGFLRYAPTDQTQIEASGGAIERAGMKSQRQQLYLQSREAGWPELTYRLQRIDSRDPLSNQQGTWYRHKALTRYAFSVGNGRLVPAMRFDRESRVQRSMKSDTLTPLSEKFFEAGPSISYKKGPLEVGASYSIRKTRRVLGDRFQPYATGITRSLNLQYQPGSHFNTRNEIALRTREFSEKAEQQRLGARDSRGVYLRSSTHYSTPEGFVDGQFLYEANTERRAIMQETYIEVGPEIGQYVWRDSNGDGVKQIDEFFRELNPNEGIYVKQFVPSDELFPVIDLRTRYKQTLKPGAWLDVDEFDPRWKQTLSNIELRSIVEIRETNTTENLSDIYLLQLERFQNDSTTLEGRLFWQQSLHLFPRARDYDLRIQVNQNRSLTQKAVGLERRHTENYLVRGSYRMENDVILENELKYSIKRNESRRLTNRNYNIKTTSVEPGLNYVLSRSARLGIRFGWAKKTDRYGSRNVRVTLMKIIPTAQLYLFDRMQTHLRIEWRSVDMNGQTSAMGLYEMTDGAGRGNSWRWSLRASYQISNLLNASLNYSGRTIRGEFPRQSLRFVINATL